VINSLAKSLPLFCQTASNFVSSFFLEQLPPS
jgi:hypothetical protein